MLLNFNQLFVLCHLHAKDPADPAEEDTPRFSMRQCRQYHRKWRRLRSPSSSLVRAASVTHAQRKFFCSLMNQGIMRLRDSHLRNAPQKGNNFYPLYTFNDCRSLFVHSMNTWYIPIELMTFNVKSTGLTVPSAHSVYHKRVRSRGAHVPSHGVYVQLADVKLGGDMRRSAKRVPERSEVNSERTFILERMYECTQWRNYANPHPVQYTLLSIFPSSEHPLGDRHPVRVVDARWVVSESGGRPSIPALLDRVTVGARELHSGTFGRLKEMKITKRLSQSVGAKCSRTMRELCGFLFHDADPLTGRKRGEAGERVAATNRHDHGLPPSDSSTNRAFKVTCHTGKVTNRLPCNLRISSDRKGKNVRLRWHPLVSYAGFLRLQDLSNRPRSYSMYGHCNTCNLLDRSSRNHRHQNHNNDRGQNNAPRSGRGTVPSVQSRLGRWRLPAAQRYGTWHCQDP
ncbi:hypothetical protein ALC56_11120 [Trachymyrmex septentrionalis]|uniref:Uncharacterized protein n=1 Tax=Trachymyrmex septentrionalis TaxID=34720 RepID=A0A195F375_9HYME|nr:hypothetical protein ALC56_11120 [Trachymyrmex septentrionalis]